MRRSNVNSLYCFDDLITEAAHISQMTYLNVNIYCLSTIYNGKLNFKFVFLHVPYPFYNASGKLFMPYMRVWYIQCIMFTTLLKIRI